MPQSFSVLSESKDFFAKTEILEWTNRFLADFGFTGSSLIYARTGFLLICAVLISIVLWWITRNILIRIIHSMAIKSKAKWDDHLVKNKVFTVLANLVPFIFLEGFILIVFSDFPVLSTFLFSITSLAIITVILYTILRFLNTARDILIEKPRLRDKPIESYFQLGKIITVGFFIVLMISIAFKVNPVVIITSMGALTAILLLIFKDTILGFVGSIQLAANDMIRIGDWITMEKFGADGDVVEINLATVKIQNFDKTITTIPTYSFISDSFKNWRGMYDSGGRRLMRAINLKIQSIKFCSPEMLKKFGEIDLIKEYIHEQEKAVSAFNLAKNVNRSVLLNGRNQTNVGVFRHYCIKYLEAHPGINPNMSLMVRQLEPTEKGIPIQLYAFTVTKEWAIYEDEVSDIFDHLLAAVHYFELEVFENPAGSDMRSILDTRKVR